VYACSETGEYLIKEGVKDPYQVILAKESIEGSKIVSSDAYCDAEVLRDVIIELTDSIGYNF